MSINVGLYRSGTVGRVQKRLVVVAAALVVAAVATVAAVVVPLLRPPGPRPAFELPVACGETWRLGTYRGHDDFDVDLFPEKGRAWGRPVLASYATSRLTAVQAVAPGAFTPVNEPPA